MVHPDSATKAIEAWAADIGAENVPDYMPDIKPMLEKIQKHVNDGKYKSGKCKYGVRLGPG